MVERRAPARRVRRRRGAVAVLAAVLVSLSGCLSRAMIFPGCAEAFPADGRLAAPPGGVARVVSYTTADGLELRGALVTGPRTEGAPPRPVAVYFHGNGESAAQNVRLADAFARAGVDVLLAEYRGYGGGPGSPSEDGLLDDARAALACASRETGVAESDLLLVGRSLGTGVVAAMAAEDRGRAVLLLSPYTSILDLAAAMVSYPIAWLAVVDTFRSLDRLVASKQPIAIVHGTEDTMIPYAHARRLAEAIGPRATLWPVGLGHNDLLLALDVIIEELLRVERLTRR
jgi:fermentation-respiration switch protein FrsA (DUF1100 family)